MTDFQRLRDKRLPKTIKAIQLIGNLSTYKHERIEAEELIAVLEAEVQSIRERFKLPTSASTQETIEEPATRELMAPPVESGRVARRYFESRQEANREAQSAPVKLKSSAIIRSTIELEPNAGWVVVIHATRPIPAAITYGWEVRVYE